MKFHIIALLSVVIGLLHSHFSAAELSVKERLLHHLLNNYEKDVEPPLSEGFSNTTVYYGMSVICATPRDDLVSLETWTQLTWGDRRLTWNADEFDGVRMMRINPSRIWTPDIQLYTAVGTQVTETMALVYPWGYVVWVPPIIYQTRCQQQGESTNCHLRSVR